MADRLELDGDQLFVDGQFDPDGEDKQVVHDQFDAPDGPTLEGKQPAMANGERLPNGSGLEAPAAKARDLEHLKAQLAVNKARLHQQVEAWAKVQDDIILQFFTKGGVPVANGGSPAASPAPLRVTQELAVANGAPAAPVRAPADKEASQTKAARKDPPASLELPADAAEAQALAVRTPPPRGQGDQEAEALAMHKETIAHIAHSKSRSKLALQATQLDGCKAQLSRFLFAKGFECAMATVIVSHVVFMTWQADYNLNEAVAGRNDMNTTVQVIEILYNTIYTAELLLRIIVLQINLFLGDDWSWNVLDGVLVVTSWYDIAASFSTDAGADQSSIAQLRVLRLMKMLKLLRMIQLMRAFRELRLIINSMMSCMKTMVWAVLLILSVAFMFGICFVQATTNFVKDTAGDGQIDGQIETLLDRWGSVPKAIISLYIASMGGADWEDFARSLVPTGWPYFYLFLLYIGFFFCVVTNTLTSLFVESAMSVSDKDQAAVIHAELEKKDKYMEKLKSWYLTLDEDSSGEVSLEEFMANVHHPDMLAFAVQMEIGITELQQFFKVLSANGTRTVNMERFIVGCIKLRGAAKSMDLMDLYYEHRNASERMLNFIDHSNREFSELRGAIVMLSGALRGVPIEKEDVIPI